MGDKKEERRLRKANRKKRRRERRAARKAARQARREARREGRVGLKLQIAEKVGDFLDNEFAKIQKEKQQKLAAGGSAEQSLDPKTLLAKYALKAVVQGAKSGLLPGFVGMVTIIPEIVGNVKSQLRMVYDLGIANGYPHDTHKDIIIYVFLDSLGKRLTGFGIIQGNQILVKPTNSSTLSAVVKIIAGYVVSQLVRSLVCKWLPGIGSAAMMAWAHHTIMKVSSNANGLYQKEITLANEPTTEADAAEWEVLEAALSDPDEDDDADIIKFIALIDLMRQDGKIQPKEKGLFLEMLQNSDFEDDEKEELLEMLEANEDVDPDLSFFQEHPEEIAGFIFDLVALAKIDNHLHVKEAGYLFEVADELNFPKEQLMQMLEA